MEKQKEYYAFISYKREDEKWAKWLQDKLEHYKFPTNLNGRTDLPRHIRPTFRDVTDLKPGLLAEEINDALQNSEWLIVVCSPRSAKSPWVCKEAQTFIDLGRADHIIPFVIEGIPFSKDSATECYPEALLNLTGSQELLGANINEMGRDAAAIKVVARMFNLVFDTLWQRHEREQKKRRRQISAAIVFAFIFLSVIAGWIWHQNVLLKEREWDLMENQARAVSKDAMSLVEEGDFYTAARLAVEVLPKDLSHPDRPYIPEAESLLRKALLNDNAILRGHTGNVTNVVYSPDGKLLASTSSDASIRLWDSKTGMCLNLLTGHEHTVISAAFSPDGKLLASSSVDRTIRIWDISTGANISILTGHNDAVKSVVFSPDGNYLASASDDKTVRIWNVKTGLSIKQIEAHSDWVNSVSYSPDGKYIVSASKDKTVKIWDSVSGKCILTIKGHSDAVSTAVFSPDSRHVYTYSWDMTAKIWNSQTGECVKIIKETTEGFNFSDAFFGPSGRYMAAISEKLVVNEATNSLSHINILKIWDMSTGLCIRELGEIEFNSNISFSPDELHLAIGGLDHLIRVIETEPGKHCVNLSGHQGVVNSVTFSYDGKLILSSSYDQKTIKLWDSESGQCILTTTDPKEGYMSARFSPDANHFVTISTDNSRNSILRVWETKTGKNVRVLQGQPGGVFYADYSADGKMIVSASYTSASYDTNVRYWDAETGECLKSTNDNFVNPSQISPSGHYLGAVPNNCLTGIEIWNLEKRERIHFIMDAHKDQVLSMAFSPDSKYLVTGSADGTIKVWNVDFGKNIITLADMLYPIRSVEFDPEGKRIVAASNKDIYIYPFKPLQQLIDEAQSLLKSRELTQEEKEKYYLK